MHAIVLQARLDSTRLPGKSLLPLNGKPLLLRVMEALNRVPSELRVLACTEDSIATFAPLAAEAGFEIFEGSRDDVLKRYCDVLRKFNIQHLIRATGDNPFVFADAAASINAEAMALGADYAGYASGLPFGAGVEAVSADALFRAESEAVSEYEHEHVCPYLYGHPEKFLLHRPLAPLRWQGRELRITVDTQEDYERAQSLYAELDRLENSGGIASEERYYGAVIIGACRRLNGD
jgi:spore coat polysaccharide biosynthesis protein SpsF